LAIGALVVVLALVIWIAVMLFGGGGHGKTGAKPPATSSTAASSAASTTTSAAPSSPPGTADSGAAKPAGTVNATTSGTAAQCPDQSLAVKVTVAQPSYRVGEQPVFGIVITNISTTTCVRDMGSGLQQVSVGSLDGQRRLWSNTDCDQGGPADVRTLSGGQQAAFTLTWSGTSAQPGCAGERVPVPAGAYAVVAQFGSVRSTPETFNIT
jgi:hypothetical protein